MAHHKNDSHEISTLHYNMGSVDYGCRLCCDLYIINAFDTVISDSNIHVQAQWQKFDVIW